MSTSNNGLRITLCSLNSLIAPERQLYLDAIENVISSGRYILDEEVAQFESEFARYLGRKYAIGVASGTDALELSLRALGIGRGDIVFTACHTSIAVVSAIERSGATPYLCDISPDTFTLSADSLVSAIRHIPSTFTARAIIPVHLYGHPAAMRDLCDIARRFGLYIIEDCAQSHGSKMDDDLCGTFGTLAAFSFYPTKNLGALGDAGCVVTDDASMDVTLRQLRQYGWSSKQYSERRGVCSRLDEVQAALLRIRLRFLDQHNNARRSIASLYDKCLTDTAIEPPYVEESCFHTYHQYVVKCKNRDGLSKWLDIHGIDTAVHYPVPIHCQPCYKDVFIEGATKQHIERLSRQILSIPVHPTLSQSDVSYVCERLRDYSDRLT